MLCFYKTIKLLFIIALVISGISSQCYDNDPYCSNLQYSWITTSWDTYTDLDSSQFVQYHVRVVELMDDDGDGIYEEGNLYFFT